jgi:nitroimidazol reductase NimA-like FMN-containing flavoprotein (pyridoxamine 5'-phosphate oxidase superfamily)
MSERGSTSSIRMSDEELWEFVREAHTAILTTLRSDGTPIALPTWFALTAEGIYMRTRGAKLGRVERNPVSSFLVEDGKRWAELRAVHFTGRCEIVQPSDELQHAFDTEMKRKYGAFRTAQRDMPEATRKAYSGVMVMVKFTPEGKIINWNNNHLGVE